MVLNFKDKDFASSFSYVALSRVCAIEHVMFETGFSRDRFPEVPTPAVKRRITEGLARKYQTFPVSLPSKALLPVSSRSESPLAGPSPANSLSAPISPAPSAPTATPPATPLPPFSSQAPSSPQQSLPAIVVSSSPVDPLSSERLRGKTLGEAILEDEGRFQDLHRLASLSPETLMLLRSKLEAEDEIALIIGTFSLSGRGPHRWMDLGTDVFNLSTLIDRQWFSARAIDGVLSQLAVLSPGVQLMPSTNVFLHLCRLNVGKSIDNVIDLWPGTHTVVFSLSEDLILSDVSLLPSSFIKANA